MGQTFSRLCDLCRGNKSTSSSQSTLNEPYEVVHSTAVSIDSHEDRQFIPYLDEPVEQVTSNNISEYVTPRRPLRSRSSSPPKSLQDAKKRKLDDSLDGLSDVQYASFPLFDDQLTKSFARKSKIMVIMRGLSGSGKSFLGGLLLKHYKDAAVVCSADIYFIQEDGTYVFDPDKLKEAHEFSQKAAETAAAEGRPMIVIDNTNIKAWEYKKYLSIAKQYNYSIVFMLPQTPWAWDPEELAKRTQHGLTLEILQAKKKQFQPSQGIYYGWFLNEADSSLLTQKGCHCLRTIFSIEDCKKSLLEAIVKTKPDFFNVEGATVAHYYRAMGPDGAFKPLHCTSMFTNKGRTPGATGYMESEAVVASLGRAFNLLITSFVITPRTIGARVLLPDDLLALWGQNDDFSDMKPDIQSLYDIVKADSENQLPAVSTDALDLQPSLPDKLYDKPTVESISFEKLRNASGIGVKLDRFHPINESGGKRAHVTIGTGLDISPVVTGFDALYAEEKERKHSQVKDSIVDVEDKKGVSYKVSEGVLVKYPESIFVFYPNEPLQLISLFSGFY